MDPLILDTSIIKRCFELREEINLDLLTLLSKNFNLILTPMIQKELDEQGLDISRYSFEVKETKINKKLRERFKINSYKNLGEVECLELCCEGSYSFLTDDYKAWLIGSEFISKERCIYFLFTLPKFNFLSLVEKLMVLKSRNKIRKIAKKTYKVIKSEIKK
jgi:rRNA-processing protein FCF1